MGYSLKKIIYHTFKYPLIGWMAFKSLPAQRQAAITPDKLIIDTPYHGQPIVLVALYQQGIIRPDIARLLLLAKEMGLFVIGVNNARLSEPVTAYFDIYIERYNFGRDFSSYKAGFEKVFQLSEVTPCPRLLMLNDSVYYDTTRLKHFLDTLIHTDIEVLGATENLELEHHLGSFCISMTGSILRHPLFHRYWAQYKSTDVRLLVIYRGELQLSHCLKACASSPMQFQALYGLTFLEKTLSDKNNVATFQALARRSKHLPWPTLPSSATVNEILDYTKQRSQIHANNAFLLHMGLPIVKLDGYYRGVFSAEDVLILCNELPSSEADELKTLLLRKPFGHDTLFGWQKILFMWGLI
jgi:hypothetical protein